MLYEGFSAYIHCSTFFHNEQVLSLRLKLGEEEQVMVLWLMETGKKREMWMFT